MLRPKPPEIPPFAYRVDDLRLELAQHDPQELARRCGATWEPDDSGGVLILPVWGEAYRLRAPAWVAQRGTDGRAAPLHIQGLLLYHLLSADGAPLSGRWIAFHELPNGRFYNAAFQGYSGGELARFFGADLARFDAAGRAAGGQPQSLGDLSFAFNALPRLPLLAAAWDGDEDFPPSYRILFDAAAVHYLPTDVCAILGGMLASRLIKAGS